MKLDIAAAHLELAAYLARNGPDHLAHPGTAASAHNLRAESERLHDRSKRVVRRCYFCGGTGRATLCQTCGAQTRPRGGGP